LSVSLGNAAGGVDTDVIGGIGIARFEDTVLCVVGVIKCAANAVVSVLAVLAGVFTGWVTDPETESISAHEIVPVGDLLVIARASGKSV